MQIHEITFGPKKLNEGLLDTVKAAYTGGGVKGVAKAMTSPTAYAQASQNVGVDQADKLRQQINKQYGTTISGTVKNKDLADIIDQEKNDPAIANAIKNLKTEFTNMAASPSFRGAAIDKWVNGKIKGYADALKSVPQVAKLAGQNRQALEKALQTPQNVAAIDQAFTDYMLAAKSGAMLADQITKEKQAAVQKTAAARAGSIAGAADWKYGQSTIRGTPGAPGTPGTPGAAPLNINALNQAVKQQGLSALKNVPKNQLAKLIKSAP